MSERPYVDFKEVKAKVSIPDALQELGLLDRFQERNGVYTGVCPLPNHNHGPKPNREQFKFDNRKGIWLWKCFGDCQRGGDVLELVKAIAELSNEHVRLWFAEHFPDRLALKKAQSDTKRSNGQVVSAAADSEAAAAEFTEKAEEVFSDLPEPVKPLRMYLNLDPDSQYLKQRGVSPVTIKRFGIGGCHEGVSKSKMFAGYVCAPVYRYPRGKPNENPVGYVGRLAAFGDEDGDRPRYKVGFDKSQLIYGLELALTDLERTSSLHAPLIVVEGVFKVWYLFQCGYPNSVSTLGSSLSDEQAQLLAATLRPIVLLFDGDTAGQQGMRKAAAKLITQSYVRVVRLGDGEEPDQLHKPQLDALIGFANPGKTS